MNTREAIETFETAKSTPIVCSNVKLINADSKVFEWDKWEILSTAKKVLCVYKNISVLVKKIPLPNGDFNTFTSIDFERHGNGLRTAIHRGEGPSPTVQIDFFKTLNGDKCVGLLQTRNADRVSIICGSTNPPYHDTHEFFEDFYDDVGCCSLHMSPGYKFFNC